MTLAKDILAIARRGVGLLANQLVALDGSAKLPAVDGSQVLNVVRRRTSSSLFTPVAGGLLTWAHGLGSTPTRYWATIVCQTDDGEFLAGDEIEIDSTSAAGASGYGVLIRADATNLRARIGASYLAITISATNGTGGFTPAFAKWKVRLWAEL